MDAIRNQLARIREQLAGLTASQRMLAGALVAIMVMTIFWWSRYAGQAEMEPILDQAMTAEDVSRITLQLQGKGIAYRVNGDRILVPADRKAEVLAGLAYAQLLPRDTTNAFKEAISKMSPFAPKAHTDAVFNRAREEELAKILRNFPSVAQAMVMIDARNERGFGESGVQPSATVSLTLRSGEKCDNRLVRAAADLVSGSVANLQADRVRVVVDGVSHRMPDPQSPTGDPGRWLEAVQAAERYFTRKVNEHLGFIEGAMVSVTVVPNNTSKVEDIHTVGPDAVVKPEEEETKTEETRQPARAGGEAGISSNVPMGLGGPGGATASAEPGGSTVESVRVKNRVEVGSTRVQKRSQGGDATVTGASVFVPRSYFVRIFKQRNPSGGEPDETALRPLLDVELSTIKTQVRGCLGLRDDAQLSIGTYTDLAPLAAAAAPQAAGASVGFALGNHAKEIAIGALAVISLMIMSLMVRRSAVVQPVAAAPPARSTPHLASSEELVGEAGEGNPLLDGIELDDDAVRAQQMLDQVSTMVKENPDGAATLVKRWLNRT